MYLMRPIRLSEKAWEFVESRRGDALPDDYVSQLIESVAGLSGSGYLMPDGLLIIDVLEAYRPPFEQPQDRFSGTARHILDYLLEAYRGKVPASVFRKKCEERGMSREEIEQAESALKEWLD
jgi:hypothetical protein